MTDMLGASNKLVNHNEQIHCDNDEMSTLQERINELLNGPPKRKASDVANYAKLSRATVSAWVNGITKTISGENAFKVARFFNVNPEWVQTGKGKKLIQQAVNGSSSYNICELEAVDYSTSLRPNEVELPFFREIELVKGSRRYEVHENHGRKLRFSKETLRKQGVSESNAACVVVSGNEQGAVLPEGSIVGIDKGRTDIKDGKMYAIDHKGNLRIKMLYKMPGGSIRLSGYNKSEYPDEIITPEQSEDLVILGQVFWSSVLW